MKHDYMICERCRKEVLSSHKDYMLFERMHYVCFHFTYEHMGDPDTACDDPTCPLRGGGLLGALFAIHRWLGISTCHGLDIAHSHDGEGYIASTVDYVGGGYYKARAIGLTPADALIALAWKINE